MKMGKEFIFRQNLFSTYKQLQICVRVSYNVIAENFDSESIISKLKGED
jgi:hypothetical protein